MEASLFNVATKNEAGEWILFNTLRSSLAVLTENAYTDYLSASGPHASELQQAGFLVDDAQAEIDIQSHWFEVDKHDTRTLSLCLAPSYKCNLACAYCYEIAQDIPGKMSQEVVQGIIQFVQKVYERDGFEQLFITWYGGEPILCLDTIETLSAQFTSFCAQNKIKYGAEIISNATLIDDHTAQRLKDLHIIRAMPTLAGCAKNHDCRRVDKAGAGSFAQTTQGIEALRAAGIKVDISVTLDKNTLADYPALRDWAHGQEGLTIFPAVIQDYLQKPAANMPDTSHIDLLTRKEYAQAAYRFHTEDNYSPALIAGLLQPVRNFCRGQLENYFVIDALGDAYKCDGHMGYQEHRLFNVTDDIEASRLETAHYNPMQDPECRTCAILPLCKGQCSWDRALLEDGCHPIKYTIDRYLKDYRAFFGDSQGEVTLLVEPRDLDLFFAKPFNADGLSLANYS